MAIILLSIAVAGIVLIAYFEWQDVQKTIAVDKKLEAVKTSINDREKIIKQMIAAAESNWTKQLGEKYRELHGFNVQTSATFQSLSKEFDVMQVRQRTLEKSIIKSERTVNLVFHGKVPVEHSNEIINTEIKNKKRGLLDRAGITPEGANV